MWTVLIAPSAPRAHSTELWRRRMRQWRCNVRLGTWLYPLWIVNMWYAVDVAWAWAWSIGVTGMVCMNNCKLYYCFIRHGCGVFSMTKFISERFSRCERVKIEANRNKVTEFCHWVEWVRWNVRCMLSFKMPIVATYPSTRLTSHMNALQITIETNWLINFNSENDRMTSSLFCANGLRSIRMPRFYLHSSKTSLGIALKMRTTCISFKTTKMRCTVEWKWTGSRSVHIHWVFNGRILHNSPLQPMWPPVRNSQQWTRTSFNMLSICL